MPAAPPPAPAPVFVPRYPELPGTYFGIKTTDPDGRSRFVQTNVVPNILRQRYGWYIWVGETPTLTHWTETLTLPTTASWPDRLAAPTLAISPDQRIATIQDAALPMRGFVSHFWEVVEGDPSGPHEIVVQFEDGKAERFAFTLAVPAAIESPIPEP